MLDHDLLDVRSGMWPAHAQRDLSFAVEPTDNNAPCAMGVQRPPVATTGRAGEPGAAHRPLVARTAARLPKFSGVTQLEPYLAQFRLAAWGAEEAVVHLALALEGTVARVLLDLDKADQRDLQALIRALERRLGERVSRNESKQLLASHRRREEESLGVYAADVQLLTRRSYPEFSAATREPWRSSLSCGDCSRRVWGSMSASPSPIPSMRLWTRRNGLRRSSAAVHPWTRLGQRPPPAQRMWRSSPGSGRAGSGRPPFPPARRLRLPLRSVGSWGWSRTAGGRGSVPLILVGRPDVGGRRRMGCPNGAPEAPYSRTWWGPQLRWSPTTPPGPLQTIGDGRPNPRGRLHRNGAATGSGQGGGAGPLNTRDCAVGVGVVGTSDP
ncbi:uncharacterized protein LOC115542938 isoform X2 [Gadus morhua]|nr:uncharacterized protein LOC115542938 isoform X2 [Gadus morhua]